MQEEQKGEEKKKEEKYRERCDGQVIFLSIFNFDTFGFIFRVSAYKPHPLSLQG
jgi:hypothetical protein